MSRIRLRHGMAGAAAALASAVLPVAACGGSGTPAAAVPSLGHNSTATAENGAAGPARSSALHAAAQCIRDHGIPSYPDPVLSANGSVYSDLQSFRQVPQSTYDAVQRACGALLAAAGFDPGAEPPPPQLVQAGVRAAECLRAHGLPKMRDPTAQSLYAPGHGFGFTLDEIPADGKFSPVFQRAVTACEALLNAETRASTLASLSNDG
jgi:hypothetical protein